MELEEPRNGFVGVKNHSLESLTAPSKRRQRIEEEDRLAEEQRLLKKREDHQKKRERQELMNKWEARFRSIAEMKWMPVAFFGVISLAVFLTQEVLLTLYRSQYDNMISSHQ